MVRNYAWFGDVYLVRINYIPFFLVTAILWWKKPLLETTIITILVKSRFTESDWYLQVNNAGATTGPEGAANNTSQEQRRRDPFLWQIHLGGIIPGLILCGLHILAWNYKFPAEAEGVIWRVCCFVSIASYLLYGFCWVAYHTPWLTPVSKLTWILADRRI